MEQILHEPYFQRLTHELARQNVRDFMTFINYESFGNPPSGQKKRVTVHVPSLEWSRGKRLNYHALMDSPDHLNELAFKCLISTGWAETAWGYKEMIVERAADVEGG
jgi:hypothetical protein